MPPARRLVAVAIAAPLLALACSTSSAWGSHQVQGMGGGGQAAPRDRVPDVQLWVSGNNMYHRGERARVYFRADDDAYVVVMRIDTDGRMRVLYPESPLDDNFVRGGVTYRVPGYGRESFYVDDYPGMGYVFAIASWRKLDLAEIGAGRRWDYALIGDRISRDPFGVMHDIAARLTGNRQDEYALDVAEYHVDRRADYPRFLCYDCHAFRAFSLWNPYAHRCAKFRILVHDDPFYYPYRHYPGTRVVYIRHQRRWPRYVLREKERGHRGPYVERRRRIDTEAPRIGTPATADALSRRTIPSGGVERPRPVSGDTDPRIVRPRSRTNEGDLRRVEPPEREVKEPPRSEGATRPRPEPTRAEPRRSDPQPAESEPRRVEPRRVEPRSTEPQRVEPRRAEPRPKPERTERAEPRREPQPRRENPVERRVEPKREDPA